MAENIKKENNDQLLPNGGYPMHTFDDLKGVFSLYIHNDDDQKMIEKAYKFVEKKHAGIFRKSGEPYIHHLIEVAYIIATLQGGPVTITAALLHDVVEDVSDISFDDLKELGFSDSVVEIVRIVTKDESMNYHDWISTIIDTGNMDAIKVKYFDMMDNFNLDRLNKLDEKTKRYLISKYKEEVERLRIYLDKNGVTL